MTEPGQEELSEPGADLIVGEAARRGLGSRPGLRRLAAISWSAFLGASCMLPVWLLVGDDCLHTPIAFSRVGGAFAICFLLALIPAGAMALLECRPRGA
ncbi:hypothetical protein SAMN04488038_10194 [Solimonas aquatica]|uniref:Uncharacterized protein n=1 Tax=Solimonas aquatica TaxID=489703 RepID=A0A1H8ZMI2_9GAMM|nr:hypothetical protein [Solimonas aquatica]SEP65507.1 hypothetical protein SAMN04488038_10194 [Solimonas aquatica]